MHGLTLTTVPAGATVRPLAGRPAGSRTIEALTPLGETSPVVGRLVDGLRGAARAYAAAR